MVSRKARPLSLKLVSFEILINERENMIKKIAFYLKNSLNRFYSILNTSVEIIVI